MALTKKQKSVLDYITDYTEEFGYAPTQIEIKDHFELKSLGSVNRYIRYLLNEGLIEKEPNGRRGIRVIPEENRIQSDFSVEASIQIPVLGRVAAGIPIEAIELADDSIAVPSGMLKSHFTYFALVVKGDSMIDDGIFENDHVICKKTQYAHNGETIVAIIDGEATLKKYYKKSNQIELHPANSAMVPIIIKEGNFQIAGTLTGLIRSYE